MNVLKKTLIGAGFSAIVAVMGSSAAMAAPVFTVNPTVINGGGSTFNASDLNFTSVATVTQTAPGVQTEVGYATLSSFGLNGVNVSFFTSGVVDPANYGIGSPYYGLYFTYTATVTGVNGFGPGPLGSVTQFDFTLYADQGRDTAFTPGGCAATCTNPTVAGSASDIQLAHGSLISGSAGFQISTGAPTLSAVTTFVLDPAGLNYFIAPVPFYQFALTSTTANSGQVIAGASDGQSITINGINGGANFIPEPLTLSIFGAGLAGAAALRRRKSKKA